MNRALWIAATGMEGQQVMVDVIANNMANVNTTGYKRSRVQFQDLLYETTISPGAAGSAAETPVGIQIGNGVGVVAVSKDFASGTMSNSGSPLDMAIEGDGFFEVLMPDGSSAFSRAGAFHLNSSGQVVTAAGYTVVGFPTLDTKATGIDIAKDGTVSVVVEGESTEKGRISLARFANPEGLRSLGQNVYSETQGSGAAQRGAPGEGGYGQISQYYLEASNVKIVREMVDMIASQRAYELLSKSIRTVDDMMQIANNIR